MRNFNNEEQLVLKYIYERFNSYGIDNNLIPRMDDLGVWNLFERIALDLDVKIEFNSTEKRINVSGFSERTYDREYAEKLFKIQYNIALIISLLNFLEQNHLIYLFLVSPELVYIRSTFNESIILVERPDGRRPNVSDLPFSSEYDYLFENYKKSIIPTPELLEFVKNDFKDKDQLRHNANVKLQEKSISLAEGLGEKSITIANLSLKISKYSLAIAIISLIATAIPLMRDCSRQIETGITNNNQLTKQQVNNINSDTSNNTRKQITNKNSTDSGLLKSKLPSTDTTKKQISVDSLKKILPRDTLKK